MLTHMSRAFIVKYTDLSMDQVRSFQPDLLDKLYTSISHYIWMQENIYDKVVVKVPSYEYQYVFFSFCQEYRDKSPVDYDHWHINKL